MIRASLFLNIAIRHNASIAQIKGSNRSGVRHSLASFYSSVAAEDSEVSSTKNESKTAIKNQQPNKNFVWNSDKNNVKQESKANNQRKNPWNKFRKGRAMPAENKIVNSLKQDHEGKGRNGYMNKNNSNNHNNYERRTDTRNAVFESKESPNSKDTTSKNDNWQTLNKSNEKTLKRPEQTSRTSGEYNGIEKLREAFMQTLSIDRQRRQANVEQKTPSGHGGNISAFSRATADNTRNISNIQDSTESRLDQLLQMSKRKPSQHQPYARRQQQSDQRQYSFEQREQQTQRRQQRQDGPLNKTFRQRSEIQTWDQNQQRYTKQAPSEVQLLQQELMKQNELVQNESEREVESQDEVGKEVVLPNRNVTILQLSSIFRVQKEKLVKILRDLGESVPPGPEQDLHKIDTDMAELIALELGLDPIREKRDKCSMEAAEMRMKRQAQEDGDTMSLDDTYERFPIRPPVVTIMGHVDHGKTTLMDRLRHKAAEAMGLLSSDKKKNKGKKTKKNGQSKGDDHAVGNIAGTEAGGITQVITAFQVRLPNVSDSEIDTVTFLDTPGHAAFKAMRQSGSNGADVIVLVVAADDGVSPQTIEIIDMYKNIARAQPGSISMVVAMTKIDKPGIDVNESLTRIENQLMEHEIFSERLATSSCEFDAVPIFPLSGVTGDGVDDLIEGLILQSEVMDLRACKESRAEGIIIDAKMEKGLGVVANCIIRWGKLEPGDYVVSGVHGGRVRILNDVNNKSIAKAEPSQPVKIVGLKTLPRAGDPIICVKSEEIAKELMNRRQAHLASSNQITSYRADASKAKMDVIVTGGASKKGYMANNVLKKFGLDEESVASEEEEEEEEIRIPVVLKADADGTLAALRDTLLAIQHESKLNLCIDPIEMSIGHVTPNDVTLASESGAVIFCFNLKGSKDKTAMSLALANKVEIRSHNVIYHLLDEAKNVFSSYCPPIPVEKIHGKAIVQAVFNINNNRNAERVAGLMVNEGKLYLDKFNSESTTLDCEYRVKRGNEVIADGLKAKSLRRVKEEVKDVRRGEECGLNLLNHTDFEEGDVIECYSVELKRTFV